MKGARGGGCTPGQRTGVLSVVIPCQDRAAFQVDKGTVPIQHECLRQKSLFMARSQKLFSEFDVYV